MLTVLLLSASVTILSQTDIVRAATAVPISIEGDAELTALATSKGWPGNGSAGNPYVISNLSVNNPSAGMAIFVHGTTKHLVIQNCTVGNTSSYAIDITGASNVTVRGNKIDKAFCGVLIYSSSKCSVVNNTVTGSKTGIELLSSDNNTVSGNSVIGSTYDGVQLVTSDGNTVTGNTIVGSGGYGISLTSSNDNLVYGNNLVSNNGAGSAFDRDHAQAYDGGSNRWSSGGAGNNWSDWSSGTAYPVDGIASSDDPAALLPSDLLLIISIVVVVVAALAVAALLVLKKRTKPAQGAVQQSSPYPVAPELKVAEPSKPPAHRPKKVLVPVAVVAVVCVVLVAALSMGLFSPGAGKLSGARDIGGKWSGTASYYAYNIYGEKSVQVEAKVYLNITLDGNQVTGTLHIIPTSQTQLAELWVPEPVQYLGVFGTYEGTDLTFETAYMEFEFSFLTDMATGKATNTDTYAYLGIESEPGAFHLSRA